MSLFVKVFTSFYTHRKTMRARAILGDDAFWVLPRLWAYAAENQPDGDFSGYSDQEIAMLIGYSKDATSMLQALLQAGFIDENRRIHDWAEHNSYHQTFADRAKVAAKARWEKERTKEKEIREEMIGEDRIGDKHCFKHATSIKGSEELVYQAYPLKVGKPAALKAIARALTKTSFDDLLAKTQQFALVRSGDTAFCPHPATWFNQERYNDDPETWKRSTPTPHHADHRAERRAREYPQTIIPKLI